MNHMVRAELIRMDDHDQAVRAELAADGSLFDGYHPRMAAVHDSNAARLKAIIADEGGDKSFRQWCSPRQRAAVCALLEHLAATRMQTFEEVGCREELLAALSWWKSGQLDR